jgi:predicted DNA-binding protein (MmcQ/YjbR family)
MVRSVRRGAGRRDARRGRTTASDPLSRLRAICLALPEAAERTSHGEPTWFAGKGKVFAMLDDHHHGAPHLSVWLPAGGAQQALIESDPKRFFRPPYVGSSGWVGVVLDTRPDWAVVAWLVEQAYRLVAHPRLVALLPDNGAAVPGAAAGEDTRPPDGRSRSQPGRRR